MTFPDIPPKTRIGPFEIQSKLSESEQGNMSQIYKAKHLKLNNRLVIIKIYKSDKQIYNNYIRYEVYQLSDIQHPNILRIYPIQLNKNKHVYVARGVEIRHLFDDSAPYYYAMEYIPSGSLFQHCELIQTFSIEWRIELLYQISLGIKYLHDKNMRHGDIKLSNIVFRSQPISSKRPEPVLVDFGIASRYSENPNYFDVAAEYASPEIIEKLSGMRPNYRTTLNRSIDHKPSDIWAFGVLVYQVLTGKHPFSPFSTDEQLIERILHSAPNLMDEIEPQIQRLILGDPQMPDIMSIGFDYGMLSKIRDKRPDIDEVLDHLDIKTSYLPPRY